jgi:hypothetical protein
MTDPVLRKGPFLRHGNRRAVARLEEDVQTLQDICNFDERLSSPFYLQFWMGLSAVARHNAA